MFFLVVDILGDSDVEKEMLHIQLIINNIKEHIPILQQVIKKMVG